MIVMESSKRAKSSEYDFNVKKIKKWQENLLFGIHQLRNRVTTKA